MPHAVEPRTRRRYPAHNILTLTASPLPRRCSRCRRAWLAEDSDSASRCCFFSDRQPQLDSEGIGDLTLCQKINDANWKRTDMKSVSGGILAGAISTTIAGLGGGMGQSTFSSNVGLTVATGATSRVIALPTGLFVIALAFFPEAGGDFFDYAPLL
jgi:Permease family